MGVIRVQFRSIEVDTGTVLVCDKRHPMLEEPGIDPGALLWEPVPAGVYRMQWFLNEAALYRPRCLKKGVRQIVIDSGLVCGDPCFAAASDQVWQNWWPRHCHNRQNGQYHKPANALFITTDDGGYTVMVELEKMERRNDENRSKVLGLRVRRELHSL